MTMSEDEFRAGLERISQQMLQFAFDYVDGDEKVDRLYVYGGNDAQQMISGVVYYGVGGQVTTLPSVDEALGHPERSSDQWKAAAGQESQLMRELIDLFVASGQEPPTNLWMVYDCQNESMDMELGYEPFGKDDSPHTAAEAWLDDLDEGRPTHPVATR